MICALLKAIGVAVLIAGTGLGVWLLGDGKDAGARRYDGREAAPVAVELAAVERAPIRDIRSFTGTLHAATRLEVAPKIGGRLERLEVGLGDPVARGQVIARLDDGEAVQEVEQARAELAVAQASLAEAESGSAATARQLERIRDLRKQQVAAQQELDAAEAEAMAQQARVRLAKAQVSQRQAALRAAEVRLAYTTIRASWQADDAERVVGERFVEEGAMIAANTPIVSVLDLDPLTAAVSVAERDYPRLRPGQAAEILVDAFPGVTFPAEIARIAPLFREESRQARVELAVPNPDGRLKPGMFVRVRVQLDQIEDAALVPVAALIERDGSPGVFTVDRAAGTARFVPVTVGVTEAGRAEIRSPALAGEVVTLGQHLLADGGAVILPEPDAAAAGGGEATP